MKKHKETEAEEILARVHGAEDKNTVQQVLLEIQGSITADNTCMNVLREFLEWKVIHRYAAPAKCQVDKMK